MSHDIHTLQPYIDGELADAERVEVEALLARDPDLRALAEEQLRIRQVLRDMPRETAPQALRARVLLELDAIDRAAAPRPEPAPRLSRLRAFLRGGAIMLPASAAAFGLFLVARSLPGPAAAPPDLAPRDLAVRIVDVPEDSSLRPVSLPAADQIVYEVGPRRVIDQRDRAAAGALPERVQLYRGARYHLAHGPDGRPQVVFDIGGVRHTLSEDPDDDDADISPARSLEALLELGHLVRTSAGRPRTP